MRILVLGGFLGCSQGVRIAVTPGRAQKGFKLASRLRPPRRYPELSVSSCLYSSAYDLPLLEYAVQTGMHELSMCSKGLFASGVGTSSVALRLFWHMLHKTRAEVS